MMKMKVKKITLHHPQEKGSGQVVEVKLFKGEGWLPVLANGVLTLLATATNEAQHRYQLFTTLRTTHLSETNPLRARP